MRTKIRIDDFCFIMEQVYHNYLVSIIVTNLMDELLDEWKGEFPEEVIREKFKEYTSDEKYPKFKYQNLKDQIESYKLSGTPMDTHGHYTCIFYLECSSYKGHFPALGLEI